MKIALAMPSGDVIAVDDLGRWQVNLSTGAVATVAAVERVIIDPATGRLAIIVLAPT